MSCASGTTTCVACAPRATYPITSVAGPESPGARTGLHDDAGELAALPRRELDGPAVGVRAAAHGTLDRRDPRREHLDEHLAVARLRDRDVGHLEHLRPTEGRESNCLRHGRTSALRRVGSACARAVGARWE